VAHVGSGITGKTSDFTLYHGHRNLVWTFVKNMPAPLLRRYLFQHLVLNLASIVRFLFLGRGRVILSAKWDALSRIRFFLIQRKKTQQNVASQVSRIDSLMKRGFFTPYLGRHG
jgi:GT2 family glycosyltransferase